MDPAQEPWRLSAIASVGDLPPFEPSNTTLRYDEGGRLVELVTEGGEESVSATSTFDWTGEMLTQVRTSAVWRSPFEFPSSIESHHDFSWSTSRLDRWSWAVHRPDLSSGPTTTEGSASLSWCDDGDPPCVIESASDTIGSDRIDSTDTRWTFNYDQGRLLSFDLHSDQTIGSGDPNVVDLHYALSWREDGQVGRVEVSDSTQVGLVELIELVFDSEGRVASLVNERASFDDRVATFRYGDHGRISSIELLSGSRIVVFFLEYEPRPGIPDIGLRSLPYGSLIDLRGRASAGAIGSLRAVVPMLFLTPLIE